MDSSWDGFRPMGHRRLLERGRVTHAHVCWALRSTPGGNRDFRPYSSRPYRHPNDRCPCWGRIGPRWRWDHQPRYANLSERAILIWPRSAWQRRMRWGSTCPMVAGWRRLDGCGHGHGPSIREGRTPEDARPGVHVITTADTAECSFPSRAAAVHDPFMARKAASPLRSKDPPPISDMEPRDRQAASRSDGNHR